MTATRLSPRARTLVPRDPKGGRPCHEIAVRLGEHILDIALEQFITRGVEGTIMDGIAAAANVSKRTLYARFGSKMGLLVAALEHAIDNRLQPVVASMRAGSPRERLLRTARKMLDLSLRPEIIGLKRLMYWVNDQKIAEIDAASVLDINPGVALVLTLLRDVIEPDDHAGFDLGFLAPFIFDAMVTVPCERILIRKDLPDTPEAKTAYLEGTLDIIAKALPHFND